MSKKLTDNQAKVLTALRETGAATVSEISDRTGVTTGRVYQSLRHLSGKGLAQWPAEGTKQWTSTN